MNERNATVIASYLAGLRKTILPPEVTMAAKQSLVDWFAVCIAATSDREGRLVADMTHAWGSTGKAVAVDGRSGAAAPIALVNATFAHALDYDDFHIASVHHVGCPTFAAALALAMDRGLSGDAVLRAFIGGFEVGVRLGMNGLGLGLGNAGWHPTGIQGHISAAAAGAFLLDLDEEATARAVGFAAAQAGGLMASAGTIAKPFIVAKGAFSGVVAAELAERGASVPENLLDGPDGLFASLFQKQVPIDLGTLGDTWEVTRNTFKPYSACQLTHASIDVARQMAARVEPGEIRSARAYVHPFAFKIAGQERPTTPLQAKFSLKHCIAAALLGHGAAPRDFNDESLEDVAIAALRDVVEIVATDKVARTASQLVVTLADGTTVSETVPAALGSLERPMSMADTERKFLDCAAERLSNKAPTLLDALLRFDEAGAIEEAAALLAESAGKTPDHRHAASALRQVRA